MRINRLSTVVISPGFRRVQHVECSVDVKSSIWLASLLLLGAGGSFDLYDLLPASSPDLPAKLMMAQAIKNPNYRILFWTDTDGVL